MATLNRMWPTRSRGGTIPFTTTFYDLYNNVVTPVGTPQVRINYALDGGGGATTTVVVLMIPPGGTLPGGNINPNTNAWVAEWDSRGAAPGVVYFSVETPGSPPVSVEDGQFTLTANKANVPSF